MIQITLWQSVTIVLGFSFLIVVLDEYAMRPSHEKRWEKRAASGDVYKQEPSRVARSAKAVEE